MRLILILLLAAIAATAVAQGSVVATVNGAVISGDQVEAEVERMIPQVYYHRRVTEDRRSEFRQQAIDTLIDRELKYQDALKRGLKADRKDVKDQMKLVRAKFSSKKEYRSALERTGVTEDALREDIERALVIQKAEDLVVNQSARVDEETMRGYYDANQGSFRQPASIKLRMLSVSEQRKAQEALAKLEKGEAFDAVAGSLSEDKFRIRGGDVGDVHRGRLVPELEAVAFGLREGEVSKPVKVQEKWYLLKVERYTAERQLAFDEVKGKIRADLEKKRAGELMDAWLGSLRKQASIERFNAADAPAAEPK